MVRKAIWGTGTAAVLLVGFLLLTNFRLTPVSAMRAGGVRGAVVTMAEFEGGRAGLFRESNRFAVGLARQASLLWKEMGSDQNVLPREQAGITAGVLWTRFTGTDGVLALGGLVLDPRVASITVGSHQQDVRGTGTYLFTWSGPESVNEVLWGAQARAADGTVLYAMTRERGVKWHPVTDGASGATSR